MEGKRRTCCGSDKELIKCEVELRAKVYRGGGTAPRPLHCQKPRLTLMTCHK
jgi:hypothetical protein